MKKEIVIILATLIVCWTIFWVSLNIKNTGISIENKDKITETKDKRTVSVSWEWKVMSVPDIVRIKVWISELANTTKIAQENTNKKLEEVLAILKEYNIPENDIQTNNLSIKPEYEWLREWWKKIVWQRVKQDLNIKISDINTDKTKVVNILDSLWEINWIELNSIQFDIDDKKELFTKARAQAFEKAKQKATELAELWELQLLKPITISESSVNYYSPYSSQLNFAVFEEDNSWIWWDSSLPSWELEVIANINVVFETK